MNKVCYKCKELKDLSAFHNRSASLDGKQASCKICSSRMAYDSQVKAGRFKNPGSGRGSSAEQMAIIRLKNPRHIKHQAKLQAQQGVSRKVSLMTKIMAIFERSK